MKMKDLSQFKIEEELNFTETLPERSSELLDTAYIISSTEFGCGDKDYSKKLMINYIKSILDKEPYPRAMIFMNSGIVFTTIKENIVDIMKVLESRGVDILSNVDCLDYYKLQDQLSVGRMANLYDIQKIIRNTRNIIKL